MEKRNKVTLSERFELSHQYESNSDYEYWIAKALCQLADDIRILKEIAAKESADTDKS